MAKILNFKVGKAKLENKRLTIETYNLIRDKLAIDRDDIVFTQAFFAFCKDFAENYNDIKKYL